MKAGDTAYLATFYGEQHRLARVTCESERRYDWIVRVEEWIVGDGGGQLYSAPREKLHPTLNAALAWLVERISARLAEQERTVAQTRAQLEELHERARRLREVLEALLPYVEDEWETPRGDYGGATDAVNAARAAISAAKKGASDDD